MSLGHRFLIGSPKTDIYVLTLEFAEKTLSESESRPAVGPGRRWTSRPFRFSLVTDRFKACQTDTGRA